MEKRLLTPREAAAFLGLTTSTLAKARLSGSGPAFVRIGRTIRYDQSDLSSWVLERRVLSTSAYSRQSAVYGKPDRS